MELPNILVRSAYTPYSIYLRGTIGFKVYRVFMVLSLKATGYGFGTSGPPQVAVLDFLKPPKLYTLASFHLARKWGSGLRIWGFQIWGFCLQGFSAARKQLSDKPPTCLTVHILLLCHGLLVGTMIENGHKTINPCSQSLSP